MAVNNFYLITRNFLTTQESGALEQHSSGRRTSKRNDCFKISFDAFT